MKMRISEKVVQAHIVQLLRSIGGIVYVMGTRRRREDFHGTMQTPGIPDVMAFLPRRPVAGIVRPILLFVECKAAGGRLRQEQLAFQSLCQDAAIEHVVGDLDDLIAWLTGRHYVTSAQFPHCRQPKASVQC